MGQTVKRNYDRYTLEFKQQAVRLADLPSVSAIEIADTLGNHVVMLYRWRMELRNGTLRENIHMKKDEKEPVKKQIKRTDTTKAKDDELIKAKKRIKALEHSLASKEEEPDLLKKAKRFFEARNRY
ncbi:MAG: transposase [Gammaproteobacteria bacterium]|nr:transposase [Gammaproteobacteria bacterium]